MRWNSITGRFELDAATGSIVILDPGRRWAASSCIYADRIHVASGTILDQLAADPQYAGYQDDLNAPAAVQRPEGVLNAAVHLDRVRQFAEHPDPEHRHSGRRRPASWPTRSSSTRPKVAGRRDRST